MLCCYMNCCILTLFIVPVYIFLISIVAVWWSWLLSFCQFAFPWLSIDIDADWVSWLRAIIYAHCFPSIVSSWFTIFITISGELRSPCHAFACFDCHHRTQWKWPTFIDLCCCYQMLLKPCLFLISFAWFLLQLYHSPDIIHFLFYLFLLGHLDFLSLLLLLHSLACCLSLLIVDHQ